MERHIILLGSPTIVRSEVLIRIPVFVTSPEYRELYLQPPLGLPTGLFRIGICACLQARCARARRNAVRRNAQREEGWAEQRKGAKSRTTAAYMGRSTWPPATPPAMTPPATSISILHIAVLGIWFRSNQVALPEDSRHMRAPKLSESPMPQTSAWHAMRQTKRCQARR